MKKHLAAVLLALVLVGSAAAAGEMRIAVVLKALDAEFWLSVKAGADQAAKDNPDIKLTVMAPDREINVQQQVQIVEDLLVQGMDALALAPCGSQELMPMMDEANKMGIPVVLIDTDAPWDKKAAYVGTNNIIGGQLAGDYIAKRLNGKGTVAFITGVMGHQTMMDRVTGAKQALEKHPGITVVSTQPANSENALAMTVMENILSSNPDLDAVFCANDPMAMGAYEAVLAEKADTIVVGFNADTDVNESIKAGGIAATVAQSSFNIGRYGVETAVKVLKGEKVPAHVDTGTELVTAENVDKFLK